MLQQQVIDYLEGSHSMYRVEIVGISIKEKGWLVEFNIIPKMEEQYRTLIPYQRVAFFAVNNGKASCKWDSICS